MFFQKLITLKFITFCIAILIVISTITNAQITVRLPILTGLPGTSKTVPISIENLVSRGVSSGSIRFYIANPTIAIIDDVIPAGLTGGLSFIKNDIFKANGEFRLSWATASPVLGSDILLNVVVKFISTGTTAITTIDPNTFQQRLILEDLWGSLNTVVIAGSATVSANPNISLVTTSSNPSKGGTTGGNGVYDNGSTVSISATASNGYRFLNWTENGSLVSTSPNYFFVIEGSRTFVANFEINSYTLTVSAVNGTVVKNPDQVYYNYGSTVQITATPSTGYEFTSWTGDMSGPTNPLTITIDGNKNITAIFVKNPILTTEPDFRVVTFAAGTTSFDVSNSGGGDINWTAVSDVPWIKIVTGGSGFNSGKIDVSYDTNLGNERVGTITISATNVTGSPKTVEIRQERMTDIEVKNSSVPSKYLLDQNYPNPFNPTTMIKFGLPENAFTKLLIYDLLGRKVNTLIDSELTAGYHEIELNASNLTSGVYFYRIEAKNFYAVKKFILLK